MNLRACARVFIAAAFFIWGLVETMGATGLVVEFSPDGRWGAGIHTFGVSGPLQMLGAAVLVFGRKTRWALIILGCYVFLASVFGNLPLIFNPKVGNSALIGLLSNLAVLGGITYWLYGERLARVDVANPVVPMTNPTTTLTVRLMLCLLVMGGILYRIHSERMPSANRSKDVVPITTPVRALPAKLLT